MPFPDRQAAHLGRLAGRWIDPTAGENFLNLWSRTVEHKLADFDGTEPVVLVVWDSDIHGDVFQILTEGIAETTFRGLLAMHGRNCSPLSAIVYLPHTAPSDIAICDGGLSRGVMLNAEEVAKLQELLGANPISDNGFWAPE